MKRIADTELEVSTLCLGGNVFGWTVNETDAFEILDAFVSGGGNFIDTADVYAEWVPGNIGGESETILGNWLATRGRRENVVIATKVGLAPNYEGLGSKNISSAVNESLRRLKTDYIDLYYAHQDDVDTPLDETLHAFDELVRSGKVRHIAASNYSAPRLTEALDIQEREGISRYVALQPHYNLVYRGEYEAELRDVCAARNVSCVPYFALAAGFLSGKYRESNHVESERVDAVSAYRNEQGFRVLDALEAVASAHHVTVAAVALAWLAAKPTVVSPIASARTIAQLDDLVVFDSLSLTSAELEVLDKASEISAMSE